MKFFKNLSLVARIILGLVIGAGFGILWRKGAGGDSTRGVLPRGVSSSYTGKRKKGKVENV